MSAAQDIERQSSQDAEVEAKSLTDLSARLDAFARQRYGMSGEAILRGLETGQLRIAQFRSDWHGTLALLPVVSDVPTDEDFDDDIDVEADDDLFMSDEAFREMFNRLSQELLGIDADEFIGRWDAGEYPDWDPELAHLVILLPAYRASAA
jgi:phage gp36-like protein